MRVLWLFLLAAAPALAQTSRDPASVWLSDRLEFDLRLRPAQVIAQFGDEFDRLAQGGALPVAGPDTQARIRAAADRARVFLAYMQYDLDGDGTIARTEYDVHADVTWGTGLRAREYAILEQEWGDADADADGRLTTGEIMALALRLYPVPVLEPLGREAEAMLGMDLDNDGFVTWPEVEAVLQSR